MISVWGQVILGLQDSNSIFRPYSHRNAVQTVVYSIIPNQAMSCEQLLRCKMLTIDHRIVDKTNRTLPYGSDSFLWNTVCCGYISDKFKCFYSSVVRASVMSTSAQRSETLNPRNWLSSIYESGKTSHISYTFQPQASCCKMVKYVA